MFGSDANLPKKSKKLVELGSRKNSRSSTECDMGKRLRLMLDVFGRMLIFGVRSGCCCCTSICAIVESSNDDKSSCGVKLIYDDVEGFLSS